MVAAAVLPGSRKRGTIAAQSMETFFRSFSSIFGDKSAGANSQLSAISGQMLIRILIFGLVSYICVKKNTYIQ
jgi:hypothetical protein